MKVTKIESEPTGNPFDKLTEKEKHQFFQEMTNAINGWMLMKYPDFDTNLITKMNDINKMHGQLGYDIKTLENLMENVKETCLKGFKNDIEDFISKEIPSFKHDIESYEVLISDFLKKIKGYDKKIEEFKNLGKCQAIFEDVYSMRDDVKKLKKDFKEYNARIKKLFS